MILIPLFFQKFQILFEKLWFLPLHSSVLTWKHKLETCLRVPPLLFVAHGAYFSWKHNLETSFFVFFAYFRINYGFIPLYFGLVTWKHNLETFYFTPVHFLRKELWFLPLYFDPKIWKRNLET